MRLVLCTWYDTVTPESAEVGDYAETGVCWREDRYQTLAGLAQAYVTACGDVGAEISGDDPLRDVAYGEPYTACYRTAEDHTDCVALRVDERASEKRKRVLRALIKRYERTLRSKQRWRLWGDYA